MQMKNRVQVLWKKYWFIIIVLTIILLKQWLISQLPIQARDIMGVDQWKMLIRAEGLNSGNYWEPYSSQAMFKRDVLFPFFSTFCHVCNISYMAGLGILYTGCNIIVLYSLSYYTRNKCVLCISFLILEFSPVSYCLGTAQFFYNLALVAPLGCGIVASLLIAYNERDNIRWFVFWNVFAGFFAICIWLNREDSQWLLILIIVYMIVSIGSIIDRKGKNIRQRFQYYICIFIPAIMMVIGNLSLCMANYYQYGIFETNDHISTGFADAYNSLLKIQPESYPESCSITHDMLERAMGQSPALAELREYIEQQYDENTGAFIKVGRAPDDEEIEDGWMPFVLRGAAETIGYYKDAVATDQYWKTVSQEIESAFDNGKLQERNIFLFGSMMKHPWVKGENYLSKWISYWKDILVYQIEHKGDKAEIPYSTIDSDIVKRYEAITYNNVVEETRYKVQGNGWLFMKDGADISLRIEDSTGKILQYVEWQPSPDISQAFSDSFDISLDNTRFNLDCEYGGDSSLYLALYDSNKVYQRIELTNSDEEEQIEGVQWALDSYETIKISDPAEEDAINKVNKANKIAGIYMKLSWPLFVLSCVIYMLACVKIICNIKNKVADDKFLSIWIYMTTIIGCILAYTGAYAYIGAFMFETKKFYTLPVSGLFDFLYASCMICFAMFLDQYKRKKAISEVQEKAKNIRRSENV